MIGGPGRNNWASTLHTKVSTNGGPQLVHGAVAVRGDTWYVSTRRCPIDCRTLCLVSADYGFEARAR